MKYPELRGLIRARFRTQSAFAKAINMHPCSLSHKLNGKTEWTAAEIREVCEALDIAPIQIPRYFFCDSR